jgi:hypothetical protein
MILQFSGAKCPFYKDMGSNTNPHGYIQPEAEELSRAAKGRPADSAGSQTLYKSGAKGKLKIMRVGVAAVRGS